MRPEVHKLLWRSRRGMLELDTLFRGYLMRAGDGLSDAQLAAFEALLAFQDQQIFDAFSGKQPLPDKQSNKLLARMLADAE